MRPSPITHETRLAWRLHAAILALAFVLSAAPVWGQPTNDNFANAIVLSGDFGTTNGSTTKATKESGEPDHAGASGGHSMWFTWTPTNDATTTFTTLGSDFDTLLAVYTGTSVNALTPVAANDDILNPEITTSEVTFNAAAGVQYYIAVDGYGGAAGNVVLNWRTAGALSPGQFKFSSTSYDCNADEDSVAQNGCMSSYSGVEITVVRVGGYAGRVLVDYAVTNDTYITNFVGTLTILTDVTNTDVTIKQSLNGTNYWTNLVGTNVLTGQTNVVDELFFTTNFTDSEGTYVSGEETVDTNFTVTVLSADPAKDYTPVSRTLVFDDYQMSQRFVFPISPQKKIDTTVTNLTQAKKNLPSLRLELSNPRLAANEDLATQPILVPGQDLAILKIQRGDAGFGFYRRWSRISEDSCHDAIIEVRRSMPYDEDVSVHYLVDTVPHDIDFDWNTFSLLAGSDYARPPGDGTHGDDPNSPIDFDSPADGVLTWPANDLTSRFIHITVTNDDKVEFNEDVAVRLAFPSQNAWVGAQSLTTLTITSSDQPAGAADVNFNRNNDQYTDPPDNSLPGANGPVRAIAIQADGKSVIGGDFTAFNGGPIHNRIARAQVNGQKDTTFNTGTGADGLIATLAIQPDQKIIAGGVFSSFNGIARRGIVRLEPTGSVDTTFRPGLGVDGIVWTAVLAPDGRIYIAGDFNSVNGTNCSRVARLNSDGSLDTSFDVGAGPNATVYSLALQQDGSVIIGGEFTWIGGTERNFVARLTPTGAVDPTFQPIGGADDTVYAVCLDTNGLAYIGGAFRSFDFESRNRIARLNSDGTLDTTFDPGSGADDTVQSLLIQPDGRLIIAGIFTSVNSTRRIGIARLFSDGPVDTSFMDTAYNQFAGVSNPLHNPQVNAKRYICAMALQADGKVMIGGEFVRVGGGGRRDSILPRWNVARLIGGETTGPGNIEFSYDSYSGDGNNSDLFITLRRVNGNLGVASVSMNVEAAPSSDPGAAIDGVDYSFNVASYGDPTYDTSWSWTRMHSDGIYDHNNGYSPTVDPSRWYGRWEDDVYVRLNDRGVIHGNTYAWLKLSKPKDAEIFYLGGENIPLGTALGKGVSSRLTIVDKNSSPGVLGFSSPTYQVNEDGTNLVFNVVRTGGSAGQVTVHLSTLDGSAKAGSDFTLINTGNDKTLTFFSGETNKNLTLPIINDVQAEPDENFALRLFNPGGGATLGLSNAVVTIIDNDGAAGSTRISFKYPGYSADESSGSARVTVLRTGSNIGALSVLYATSNLTAQAGLDYAATSGTLSWDSLDSTPRTIVVPLLNDGLIEGDETVALRLYSPSLAGALGAQSNAVLTILDDDHYGAVQFNATNYLANENGGPATITVVRVGGSAQTITVQYMATNAPGITNAIDPVTGTLTFAPGEVSKTFNVVVRDRNTQQGNTTAILRLFNANPTNTLGSVSNSIITIIDDESFNEPAGAVDTTFSPLAGANDYIYSVVLQNDGKLLLGGDFTQVNGIARNRIARLNADGTLDYKFSSTTMGANAAIRTMLSQTDGRIVLGGSFTVVNNTNRNCIARLNLDGSSDPTFNPGAGADNPVYALAETFIGTNRMIVIGGAFNTVNASIRHGIARLTDTGVVDPAFDPGVGANGTVYAIAVQNDGKVIIAGDFTAVAGVARNRIARLNADGTLDASFNPVSGANAMIRAIALQFDGKIVIGGTFTSVNGVTMNSVARLNSDGSLDAYFTPGAGANQAVYAIALQIDGRIVLGGEFTEASGVTRNRITRLNADGTVDPKINFGAGANNFVSALAIQPDRRIVLVGGFTEYDGASCLRIARIYGGSMAGEGRISFTSGQYQIGENETNAVITLRRTGGTDADLSGGEVVVTFATTNGTAQAGQDYITTITNVGFPVGETFRTVTVPIINDNLIEPDETVQLALLIPPSGSAELGPQPTATLTILNEDSAINFASSTFRGQENAINGSITLTLVRSGSTRGPASVEAITIVGGTASPGNDYATIDTIVPFADGQSTATVTVGIVDDSLIEPDETFTVELRNPTGAFLLSPSSATVTIVDNDFGPGVLAFASPAFNVAANATNAWITVVRKNGVTGTVTVNYATQGGSASPGTDYTPVSGTLVFGDGETNKSFCVPIFEDPAVEGTLTVGLILSNATGYASIVDPASAVLNIDEDCSFVVPAGSQLANESGPTNGVVDANETVSMWLALRNVGSANTTNLTATLLSTNGVASPSPACSYGVLVPNGASVSRQFTFTAAATNGGQIRAVLRLQDGARALGHAVFTFDVGSAVTSFTNPATIIINDLGGASPYPSSINVSGVSGRVRKATVTLLGVNHHYPADIDALLVSPAGGKVMLMSDAGLYGSLAGANISFDDGATNDLPVGPGITSGAYRPTDYEPTENLPAPAPARPYGTNLSAFGGQSANGFWYLYVADDSAWDTGTIQDGWILSLSTGNSLEPTCDLSVSMNGSPNPVIVGDAVTYTITVTNHGPSDASGVTVMNTLPSNATFVSATGNYSVANNQVLYTIGSLAKDASATVTLVLRTATVGSAVNTATAQASEADPNSSNSSASAITTVAQKPQVSAAFSGNLLQISWPSMATNYVLESTPSLSPAVWTPVTNPLPTVINGNKTVSLTNSSAPMLFFRLRN